MSSRERKTFGVVSPAGGLAAEDFDAGLAAAVGLGFAVKVFPHAREREGYLSASAEMRAADLAAAWRDPEVDAILCSRGGFGSAHLLPLLEWGKMREHPLPLLGYSDITALHLAMDKFGVGRPVAAPMLRHFPKLDAGSLASLCDVLDKRDREFRGVEALTAGAEFSGRPLAGNLAVTVSLLGTPYFPDPTGRVFVLEEVGEPLYRIDRMLTQLEHSGALSACSGVVFGAFSEGDFTDAELRELLFRVMRRVGRPAVIKFQFGHELPFQAVDLTAFMKVENGKIEQLFG